MALLPEGLAPGVALLLMAASAVTSGVTAALGLGGGVLLLAGMASLVPAAALIPLHGVVQLGSNAGRAALMVRQVARAPAARFLAGSLPGIALGALVATWLPGPALQGAVGLFILWSVLSGRVASPGGGVAAGAVSSALTMVVGATGPFVMAWIRRLGLDREATVATHAALMTAQHGLKVAAFGLLGAALLPWAPLAAAMIATGFLGTLAGRHLLRRTPERRFRRVLDALLVLAAGHLLWSAWAAAAE